MKTKKSQSKTPKSKVEVKIIENKSDDKIEDNNTDSTNINSHKSTGETSNAYVNDVTVNYEKLEKVDKISENTTELTENKENLYKEINSRKSEGDASSITMSMQKEKEDSIFLEVKKGISPTNSENENKIILLNRSISMPMNLQDEMNKDLLKDFLKRSLDLSNQHKQNANLLFKKNKFKEAIQEYQKAIDELNQLIENNKKVEVLNMTNINWVRLECLNNISVCYLLLKEFNNVLNYTKEGLKINPHNFIALSYRAKALKALDREKEALDAIRQALSVKYSKTLINLMKETEDKISFQENEMRREIEILPQFDNLKENSNLDEDSDSSTNLKTTIKNEDKNRKKDDSFFTTFMKFTKIFSFKFLNFMKKYKIIFLIILIMYVIIFRRRLKNKLLHFLKIKFD